LFIALLTYLEDRPMSKKKIGAGHAAAMARLGLKELRNMANPSRESIADYEIGLYGTQTQGEIAEARGGPGTGPDQEGSNKKSMEDLRKDAQARGRDEDQGQGRDGMDM
jgi:hypothetical protein